MFAYEGGAMVGSGEAAAAPVFSFQPTVSAPAPVSAGSTYGERNGPNWTAVLAIVALHIGGLGLLAAMDVIHVAKPKPQPLVISLIAEQPAPPPAEAPQPKPVAVAKVQPVVIAPPPIVSVTTPTPPVVATAPTPAPPRMVVVSAAPAAPSGPVSVSDLSAKLIDGKPPRYPIESRRKREQGTVVLDILLNTDGTVASLAIAHSSGFDRLDKAALDAVRKWRWSPTMRGGQAVAVRGTFDFPFTLQG